ncbi:MAG: Gfo/Idh/MocA family oxidoreductase [Planctomycetota bacterium]|nr:Gfo/Idh/MocA family oxidoreductase [Planctomycetota bacterium]
MPTRRRFLQGTAAAAPFVLGACSPLLKNPPASDDPDVLRVGLVGCGGRGTGAAYQAVNAEPGTIKLVAMGDVFADRLDSSYNHLQSSLGDTAQARMDVPEDRRFVGFDAYQKVIDSGVDVVVLTTPPHFRPEHIRAALAADKHVFCEKPMAVDAPGVRSVMASAREAKQKNLALVSGFCWRKHYRYRSLYERILEGGMGDLQVVYSTYNASPLGTKPRQPGWSEMEFQLRNWQHMNWLGGDSLVEQACHSLDKMGWAFGDIQPLSCTAVGGRQARFGEERGDIFDHFAVTYDYPEGKRGFHMSRQMANCSTDNSDFAYGTKGRMTARPWADLFIIEGESPWESDAPGNDMYQTEHNEMFASIRAGNPVNDGDFMTGSTMLSVMGRLASYTGQTVTWEQAMASTDRLGPEIYAFGSDVPEIIVPIPGRTRLV